MIPSIYINLEDDVSKIVTRIKKERASELVLVCPKRCFLFNDSINLRLLKKQVDLLNKKVFILTMDDKGQLFAKEAGFELKNLPKVVNRGVFSDIGRRPQIKRPQSVQETEAGSENVLTKTMSGLKNLAMGISSEQNVQPEKTKPSLNSHIHKKSDPGDVADNYKSQVNENIFPTELQNSYKPVKDKKHFSKVLAVFLVLALIVASTVIFLVLPQASVAIYPKTQSLTRDLPEVLASPFITEINPSRLAIPAAIIDRTVNAEIKFQSQGKKDVGNKASGSVVIYNFTGSPLNLRAKTTILTLNNKNYTLLSDVLGLKPTKYKNAQTREIDESSLAPAVNIEAAEGGESYNVPAGTRIEVTNQVFGSNPQLLYGKVNAAISGGTSRYLSIISQNDINSAKEQLARQVYADLSTEIAKQVLVIDEKAFELVNPQFTFDHEVGTETPEFTGKISAQALGLAYNPGEMEDLVLKRIRQSLAADSKINIKLFSPLKLNLKSLNLASSTMVFEVHFDGLAVADTEGFEGLAEKIKGKSQEEAINIIKSLGEVDKVEITLTPSWMKWLPWLSNKISVNIND